MTKGYVRRAEFSDVKPIADDMRPADVAEVYASAKETPEGALNRGLLAAALGGRANTICLPDGTPVGMFGVSKVRPGAGLVWMLASNGIHEIQRQFLRESRDHIAELGKGYRVLFNFTDARNTVHHRWIKWAGFTIIKRYEMWGDTKSPFLEFCRITEPANV